MGDRGGTGSPHRDRCAVFNLLSTWKPHPFAKLDFLYVSCDLMDECPNPPILSPSQTEKIAEQRLKLQRGDPVPPRTLKLMVPLAPLTWNPS